MEKTKTKGLIDDFESFSTHTGSAAKRVLKILLDEFDSLIEETGRGKEEVKSGEFFAFVEAVTSHAIHEICDLSNRTIEEVLLEMLETERKLTKMMEILSE